MSSLDERVECRGVARPAVRRPRSRSVELAAPGRDADVGDVVDGGVEDRIELVAQRVGPPVGRLDRGERALRPRSAPSSCSPTDTDGVRAERLAGRRGRGDQLAPWPPPTAPPRPTSPPSPRRWRRSEPARPDGPRSSRASTPRTPRPRPSSSTEAASALDARPDRRPNGVGHRPGRRRRRRQGAWRRRRVNVETQKSP